MIAAVRTLPEHLNLRNVDQEVRQAVEAASRHDPDFWAFRLEKRVGSPAYFQYPAMMVPSMQRELLRTVLTIQPRIRSALEPFAGSGTVLVEAMYAGLSVHAQDINPLAVLLCKNKATIHNNAELREHATRLVAGAKRDRSERIEAEFPTLRKWFRKPAIVELSRLRRAIRRVPTVESRRFFWVALAETVRRTSNSRTSTYKLHIRTKEQIATLASVLSTFEEVLETNLNQQAAFETELSARQPFGPAGYGPKIVVKLEDSRKQFSDRFDVLVTSPPYGDNTTTVPYGQAAFLPLQWIDLADIDSSATEEFLRTSHEIDSRSLGGQATRGDLAKKFEQVLDVSPSLAKCFKRLKALPRDRANRVLGFARDLSVSVNAVTNAMNPNAYLIWTVGNRWVGQREVPLQDILSEFLVVAGADPVLTIRRRIHQKRMPFRNAISKTMRREYVVIFRRNDTGAK